MGYFGGGHIKEYHEYAMNNAIKLTTEGFGQYILPGVMIQPFEHFMAVESWTVDEGVHPTYEHDNYDSLLTLDVSLKGKVKWVGLNNLETNERNWRSEQHISEVYSRLVTFLKNNSARIIRSHNGDTIEEAVERVIHVPADSKDKRIYFLDLDHIGFNSIEKR